MSTDFAEPAPLQSIVDFLEPEQPRPPDPSSLLGLIELILKRPWTLEGLIRRPDAQRQLVPRLLGISLLSFLLFGCAMAIVIGVSEMTIELRPMSDAIDNGEAPLVMLQSEPSLLRQASTGTGLVVAYAFGLIAATGICLPSLYFYGLLSGVKLRMLDVVVHALKSKATTAVALVGILPVYVAVVMGVLVFDAPPMMVRWMLWLGLALPFIAGLWGTASLYRGFSGLADTLPAEVSERRGCFLRRLVVSWSACYTAVGPVMIFTVWESLSRVMQVS